MPKKTKREKVIAQYHRKLSGLGTSIAPIQDDPPNKSQPQNQATSYTYAYTNTVKPSVSSTEEMQPYDLSISRDLIKTLILASIAIGGEIVLSLTIK